MPSSVEGTFTQACQEGFKIAIWGYSPTRRPLALPQPLPGREQKSGGRATKHSLSLGVFTVVLALTLSACGGGVAGRDEHQQGEGRPLPKFNQAIVPAGRYHTTEFEPSLSLRISGDDLFIEKVEFGEIAFFNLRKLKGVYKPKGPRGEIEPMPAPDEVVGWFHHQPYLKASKPESVTVGGYKGVPVVIYYDHLKEDFDEFSPVAEKVLQSVEWTGT
jgi:hypothetical protein